MTGLVHCTTQCDAASKWVEAAPELAAEAAAEALPPDAEAAADAAELSW